VSPPREVNALGDKQHATIILRLLLDRHGRLLRGEAIDVDARPCGQFVRWQGIVPAVKACLANRRGEPTARDRSGD
jgi:hypothetical protein